jgi:GH24 family phage-related lysozyme (muramidase)
MARNRRRIDGLPEAGEPVRKAPPVRVAAAPVNFNGPAPADNMRPLIEGLSAFNPALQQWMQEAESEEKTAGAKARVEQKVDVAAPPPEANKAFREGYMTMHGQVAGNDLARKMRLMYEENKNKPDFDPEKANQLLMDSEMKGFNDPHALKGFLPAVVGERQKIRADWGALQIERVRQDTDAKLGARARDLVDLPIRSDEEGVSTDPAQTRHALYQQFVTQGMALGKTRPELAKLFAAHLANRAMASGEPTLLDMADVRDESGIALNDNPEIKKHLIEARKAADAVQKKQVIDATVGERTNTLHTLYETLRVNPRSPDLDWDSLLRHQGTYLTFNDPEGKDIVAFYEKVMEARAGAKVNDQILEDLDGPRARIAAARPEAQPLIKARYGQVWDAFDEAVKAGDQFAVERFVATNLSLHQQWGVGDERLKNYLSNINTDPTDDGKPRPDFQRAYHIYSAIMRSPNKELVMDLTTERSRTLLRNFRAMIEDEGMPMNDAFARAQELNTAQGKERLESLNTPDVRAKFAQELKAKLQGGSWMTLGLTGRAPNKDLFVAEMTNVFQRKLMALGDRERAMKQTLDSVDEYLVRDGHSNWTQRPDSTLLGSYSKGQGDFEKGLTAYTLDLAAVLRKEHGVKGDMGEILHLERIGQGEAYTVKVNGVPRGRVELSEILARGAAKDATYQDAEYISTLLARVKSGAVTGEEIRDRMNDIMQLRDLHHIDAREYERLMAKRRKWEKDTIGEHVSQARAFRKNALGGMKPGDPLNEPGGLPEDPRIQPGGKNLKTADYAMQAAQKGNLTFALTAQAEGFMTKAYADPAKGTNIGLGFSMTSRSKPETASMLRRAGVPSGDVDKVMAGKMEITPDAVIRLHEIAVDEYRRKAISAVGADVWRTMKPEAQAVLTDMAWATGNPAQFKSVIEAMRKGDYNGASAALSLKYTDRNGEQKNDTRRVNLWRLMLSGRDTYSAYLKKHTSK